MITSFIILLIMVGTVVYSEVELGPNVTIKAMRMFVGEDEYFVKGMAYSPSPAGMEVETSVTGVGYCTPHPFITLGTYDEVTDVSPCFYHDFFDGSQYNPGPTDGWAAVWQRDFPLIQSLGVNTIRIYHTHPITSLAIAANSKYDQTVMGSNHVPFLDLAERYGFKVIFPFYSAESAIAGAISEEIMREYIRNIIDEVGYHTAVLMYEFGNELQFFNNGEEYRQTVGGFITYARWYQNYRWGRTIPITTTLIDIPPFYDVLSELPIDVITTNAGYRGYTFSDLWLGNAAANFSGMRNLSCQTGKPVLIGEMGVHHDTPYFDTADWFPRMFGDIIAHKTQGAIGGCFFEWSEEHWKGVAEPGQDWTNLPDVYMGIVRPVQVGNSTELYGWTVDEVTQKYIGAYNWTAVTQGFSLDEYAYDSPKSLSSVTNNYCSTGPMFPVVPLLTYDPPPTSVSTTSTTSSSGAEWKGTSSGGGDNFTPSPEPTNSPTSEPTVEPTNPPTDAPEDPTDKPVIIEHPNSSAFSLGTSSICAVFAFMILELLL